MKTFLAILIAMLLSGFQVKSQQYAIGKYDTLYSPILKQKRVILVHVPSHQSESKVSYPVMYLLDGDAHFTKTIGILDHLSRTAGNEVIPQMMVVAIFHPNREQDLIPPATPSDSLLDLFPQFLEKELIPYIQQKYPTQPYRTLVGHSLGGLRVIQTFLYQTHLFQSYLALDPSLGMVKNWIGYATQTIQTQAYPNKSLYIALGMTMPKGMDTATIIKDTSGNARHMRCIMTFARAAEAKPNKEYDFHWKYYPEESHQSVVFTGTYEGLSSNFNWYKNQKLYDIFKPEVDAQASVKIITDYYSFLSQKMGYTQIAPEQGTAELIDYLFFKRWYDKALAFANLNHQNYPQSNRTQYQLYTAQWNIKKSLSLLYPQKSAKEIYAIAQKDQSRQTPEYNISEEAINQFGYELLGKDKLQDAEWIFKLNVALYPNSYNVYDSFGECLLLLGKENEGYAAYQKSLEINPQNTNAKNILKQKLR
jgi:uncharacterized protein